MIEDRILVRDVNGVREFARVQLRWMGDKPAAKRTEFRLIERHTHVATSDDADTCATCGCNFRNEIHLRVGETT